MRRNNEGNDAHRDARKFVSNGQGANNTEIQWTQSTQPSMSPYAERLRSRRYQRHPESSPFVCESAEIAQQSSRNVSSKQLHLSRTPNLVGALYVSLGGITDLDLPSTITIPDCKQTSVNWNLLHVATLSPPVTTTTLKELDLQWIQNNINLRIDIQYDYDVHFMPISGRRGEEKRMLADTYWRSLAVEFEIYHHGLGPCSNCSRRTRSSASHFPQRLPSLFQEIKALLFTLVPNDDHSQVDDALDIDLLMQQVITGTLDTQKLANWLKTLLMTHCAPIRDELARDISAKISEGAQRYDSTSLVAGLEKLFSLCEAMKLDVANHQIRTFRFSLIENGVSFQRDYFQTRIRLGKLDPASSLSWFRTFCEPSAGKGSMKSEYTSIVRGFVSLATQTAAQIPELLKYDHSRLQQLRAETSDLIHLDICWDYLKRSVSLGCDPSLSRHFKKRLLDLTDGQNGQEAESHTVWDVQVDSLSTEVTRAISTLMGCSTGTIPTAAFSKVGEDLKTLFHCEPQTRLKALAAMLEELVLTYVDKFRRLSSLQISEVQQHFQQWRQKRDQGRAIPDMEDIARRLAHMIVMHWSVWRDIVYLPETERIASVAHLGNASRY